jgi:uncharacterized caspase-like protein
MLLICFCTVGLAQQPRKLALVIGNGNYQHVNHLPNPPRDADLIGSKLSSLGFTLVGGGVQKNVALSTFNALVTQFATSAADADVALFYYAGHGVQVNGTNYLVPLDSNPSGVADVPLQMVDASAVLSELDNANPRLKILILDACRNNPFASRGLVVNGLADMSPGLAQMTTPRGTVIWYATQPGSTALDGVGNDGPFALAIAHNISSPGTDIYTLFNQVGNEVMNSTNPQQIPWIAATPLDGVFYFSPPPGAKIAEGAVPSSSRAIFTTVPTDSTPSERIRRLFSSGVATPTRDFTLDETYQEINMKLDQPFGITSWSALPVAGEYPGEDVRYFWVRATSLPVITSAILPDNLESGQCIDPQSYIAFLFKNDKLFRISIRLYRGGGCHSYGWLANYLFSSDHRSALIHGEHGDTTVDWEDTADFSILQITRLSPEHIWLN